MSDKMNPFHLGLPPKIHSASKYIPSNSPHIPLDRMGRFIVIPVHIKMKGSLSCLGLI